MENQEVNNDNDDDDHHGKYDSGNRPIGITPAAQWPPFCRYKMKPLVILSRK